MSYTEISYTEFLAATGLGYDESELEYTVHTDEDSDPETRIANDGDAVVRVYHNAEGEAVEYSIFAWGGDIPGHDMYEENGYVKLADRFFDDTPANAAICAAIRNLAKATA